MTCVHKVRWSVKRPENCRFNLSVSHYKDRIVAPDEYSGATVVTPSDSEQVLPTTDKLVREDITINPAPTEVLSTDHNGTFTPSDGRVGFSQVSVDVQPDLRPLSVSDNGSYTPDGFDGYSQVTVDVEQIDALKFLQGTYYPLGYLRFPDGITVYDNLGCFVAQTGLSGVDLNDIVTVKGGYNFKGCSNLETAIAPNLQSADNSMFHGCTALYANDCLNMTKNFPNLLFVSSNMFCRCNFSSLILSPSITRLSSYCFDHCAKLEKIYYTSKIEQFGVSPFNACNACTDIYVPWSEGEVAGASWHPNGFNGTIHYDTVYDENWNVVSST